MSVETEAATEHIELHAEASEHAAVTQIAGDYEEHHHRYVRGWEYLKAPIIDPKEVILIQKAYVPEETTSAMQESLARRAARLFEDSYSKESILVLVGDVGSGRRTTAVRILLNAAIPPQNIHSLTLDWDRPRAEQIPPTPNHGFILDLSNYKSLPEDFYQGLADYHRQAIADGTYLIILATPNTWNPSGLLHVPRLDHVSPLGIKVAHARLEQWSPDRVTWLEDSQLAGLLGPASPPADAVRLARIITDHPNDERESIKGEFNNWTSHLKDWFESEEAGDLRERALLISAAFLEGAPAGIVVKAADRLFELVDGVLPVGGALAGPDIDRRLEIIDAKRVDHDEISLSAAHRGLHDAVLPYVWKQRPLLREVLLEWASEISAPKATAVNYLERMAQGIARLAAGPGGISVLQIVEQWAEADSVAHRRLAVSVLGSMAVDPNVGATVRKALYDWAKQKNVSEALAETIAEVCAGAFGKGYPRMALTRLRLLASRVDGRAAEAVARSIRTLVADRELRDLVLSEVVGWAESADLAMRQAGSTAFLALTELTDNTPLALSLIGNISAGTSSGLSDQPFIRGWRAAWLHGSTAARAKSSLEAWLDSAEVSDDLAIDVAAAVLEGRLSNAGVADLLVGTAGITEKGRERRAELLNRLMPDSTPSTANTSTYFEGAAMEDFASNGKEPNTAAE